MAHLSRTHSFSAFALPPARLAGSSGRGNPAEVPACSGGSGQEQPRAAPTTPRRATAAPARQLARAAITRAFGGLIIAAIALFSPRIALAQECFPACRGGFACVQSKCVSACNPACGAGELCRNGDCVPAPGATSPPPAPAATSAPQAPEAPPTTDAGAKLHNGLFLRMGLGGGYIHQKFSVGNTTQLKQNYSNGGGGLVGEFLLGGTPARGLVVGGGTQGGFFWITTTDKNIPISTSIIGPFVDYYFDPTKGFHAQAMLGYAMKSRVKSGSSSRGGLGASVGVGQEWWLSPEWSAGILGRLQYYRWNLDDGAPDTSADQTFIPGLLVTFTYH